MADSVTLIKANPLTPAQDYNGLRATGLNLIEKLGSNLWTNYNYSDPGITILEAVCYAITDLSYRTGFEMKDLLTPENLAPDTWKKVFYTARNILSNNALTLDDYRKIIIDVTGIRNAWIFVSRDYEVPVWIDYNYWEERKDPDCECSDKEMKGCFGRLTLNAVIPDVTDPAGAALVVKEEAQVQQDIQDLQTKIAARQKEIQQWTDSIAVPPGAKGKKIGASKDADAKKRAATAIKKLTAQINKLNEQVKQLTDELSYLKTPDGTKGIAPEILEMRGLYNVVVEYEDNITSDDRKEEISQEVFKRLMSQRNLCEDFLSVDEVEYDDFGIKASLELTEDADPDAVLAQILFAMYTYFTPTVPFYTIEQMIAKGYEADEIFEGPALTHGFIDNNDLDDTALYRDIMLSDIINDIMQIPGVTAITYFHLSSQSVTQKLHPKKYFAAWIEHLQQQQKIARVVPASCEVIFCKKSAFISYNTGNSTDTNPGRMLKLYNDLKTAERKYKLAGHKPDLPVPAGEYMELGGYYPVTYSLPLTYGVNDKAGLPANASQERKDQALQLQGYFMFFEQILADYLVQLNSLKELFSFDEVENTYFTRAVSEIDNLTDLLTAGSIEDFAKKKLPGLAETRETFITRRNLFLNHMLARFGEDISQYEALMKLLWPAGVEKQMITDKQNMLKDGEYIYISADRGRAYDYALKDTWDTYNESGAERRIGRLLGFDNVKRHDLVPAQLKISPVMVTDPGTKQPVQKKGPNGDLLNIIQILGDDGQVVLTSVEVANGCCTDSLIYDILQFAGTRSYYKFYNDPDNNALKTVVGPANNLIELYDGTDIPNATLIASNPNNTFTQVKKSVDSINKNEGLHLVEHLLLRPKIDSVIGNDKNPEAVSFLNICLNDCDLRNLVHIPHSPHPFTKQINRIPGAKCYDNLPWELQYLDSDGDSVLYQSVDIKTGDGKELTFKTYNLLAQRVNDLNQYGADSANYTVVADNESPQKWGIIIYGKDKTALAQSLYIYSNVAQAPAQADETDVQTIIERLTGYFGYMMDLSCGDESCNGNEDPYSFRTTVVLPCWPKRFNNPLFRKLVEQTVLSEMPAHIHPHIVWVGISEMQRFETAYKSWLSAMASDDAMPDYSIVNPLVDVINTLEPCCDCDDDCDDPNTVIS